MSTGTVARDQKYTVGSNTAGVIKTSPSTLYYESQYSFLPPSCQPSQGAIIRCDVYNSASVAGILTHLDLNFDLDVPGIPGTEAAYLSSLTKAMEWLKIYINNVEVMWLQDRNTIYMNYMRNIVIDSNSAGDAVNKFKFQGGIDTAIGIDYPTTGPSMNFQTLIRDLAISVGERAPRVQIPLDDICSFLFHKFDTRLADKISVEIKFKNNPTGWLDTEFISSNLPAGAPIYPSLRVTNAFITQRSQLYTDPSILWNLSTPWMKPMIKTEVQAFPLGPNPPQFFNAASAVTNPQNNPLRVRFRLSDAFALHKRIIGMSLQVSYADPGATTPIFPGVQWGPNMCNAKIYKGGDRKSVV